jgi:hypothetical protein
MLLISIFAFCSCNFNNQNKKTIIYGSWILQNKESINYPEIIFNKDLTAIFKSKADTIYRYYYEFNGSKIILKDLNNKKETYEVLKLNKDSLVFRSLRENLSQQIYIKRLDKGILK